MTDHVLTEGGNPRVSTQGIREAVTAATTRLGTVKPLAFDKEVIYAFVASAVSPGNTMQAAAVVANHQNRAVAVAASIGEKEVILSLGGTSAVQDYYEDGTLLVTCGTGTCYSYMVQGHEAWAATNTAAKVILKDGLEAALNTASICSLIVNKCKGVVVTGDSALLTGELVGVTLISAAASSFVYLGKKGEWPCKLIAATLVGGPVFNGTACTTGALGPYIAGSDQYAGICRQTASAGLYGLVDFKL